jgi:hypothetical protein
MAQAATIESAKKAPGERGCLSKHAAQNAARQTLLFQDNVRHQIIQLLIKV